MVKETKGMKEIAYCVKEFGHKEDVRLLPACDYSKKGCSKQDLMRPPLRQFRGTIIVIPFSFCGFYRKI